MNKALTDADESTHALSTELRTVLGRLARRLRGPAGTGDITPSQKSVLSRLESGGPATKSELARAEGVSPQSMGVIITALETIDLVVGAPDETDGRKTRYLLSGAARVRYSSGRLAKDDWLFQAIAANLTPNEEELLEECLPLLRRLAHSP